eukprot:6471764-Pyramimonas_sp.AAC.1
MPELGLLPELGPTNYSYSAIHVRGDDGFSEFNSLQISCIALRRSNEREIIRSDSLEHQDA